MEHMIRYVVGSLVAAVDKTPLAGHRTTIVSVVTIIGAIVYAIITFDFASAGAVIALALSNLYQRSATQRNADTLLQVLQAVNEANGRVPEPSANDIATARLRNGG